MNTHTRPAELFKFSSSFLHSTTIVSTNAYVSDNIYIFLDVRSSGNVINLIVCIMCLVLKLTKMYLSD